MTIRLPTCRAVLLLFVAAAPASALLIREYDPEIHDRFTGFPDAPLPNPSFLFDESRFSALARLTDAFDAPDKRQFTLVTRQHCLFTRHNYGLGTGTRLEFVKAGGVRVERFITSLSVIVDPSDGVATDLILVKLDQPLEPSDGIDPFPYLELNDEDDYLGRELAVFGWFAKAGRGLINSFETVSIGESETEVTGFSYPFAEGAPSDARFEIHDSGSPSFVIGGGQPALVGLHIAIDQDEGIQQNFDIFVPAYIEELDALLVPQGFRMRPHDASPALLGLTAPPPSGPLRRGGPGQLSWTISNPSISDTGNLEVTLIFPAGSSPDSISGPGWVAEDRGGGAWRLRKGVLEAGGNGSFTAHWAALPFEGQLTAEASVISDTAPEINGAFTFELAPSFADWAAGLGEAAPGDDPDEDGLANLLEYALGGDPESGGRRNAAGEPLGPLLTGSGGMATLSFPERSDKVPRGISYVVEFSGDLTAGSWSSDPPPGLASSLGEFSPPIPGFVRRSLSWPAGLSRAFVRLRVDLDE